jgi:CheY-like chemotaxis protein
MVVDDEKDILEIITMALEKYDYSVRAHTDPRSALEDTKKCTRRHSKQSITIFHSAN